MKINQFINKLLFLICIGISSATYAEEKQDNAPPSTEAGKVNAIAVASADEDANTLKTNPDPLETFNRAMFHFNDIMDTVILKPVARAYNTVLPKPVVKGIGNFFSNIDTLPTVANDVLQGNFYQAANDAWRLGVNTTVGILGFFDVATQMGLEPNKEDFGLTLARWGWENSTYIVLPFFGPSTIRDGIGLPVDYYYLSVYPHIHPTSTRYVIYGVGVVSRRADLLRFDNVFEEVALDKYVFLRDAYFQRRAYLMERNKELSDPYMENNTAEEDKKSGAN